jgi:hypothetical protein
MNLKRKAEICDAIIARFDGNKTIYWKDLHGNQMLFNDLIKDSDCKKTLRQKISTTCLSPF